MKVSNFIATLLFFTLLAGCDKNTTSNEPRGGWYVISDQNEIMGDALFNRYDIDQIWIETSPGSGSKSAYIVTGSSPRMRQRGYPHSHNSISAKDSVLYLIRKL